MSDQQPCLRLYHAPLTCALSCYIALEESGLAYDTVRLDIAEGENQEPRYLEINPTGKVPTLVVNGATTLTEAHAILTYIGELASDQHLLPTTGTLERIRAHEWMSYISSTVHIAFRSIFRPSALGGPHIDEAIMREFGRRSIAKIMAEIDRRLDGKRYALGDAFSVCDAYLFVCYLWSHVDLVGPVSPAGKNFHALAERLWHRPAIQEVAKKESLTALLPF